MIEDDPETAAYVAQSLREERHAVSLAKDGPEGLATARNGGWDIIIVDRLLPELDGVSVVRRLRAEGIEAPVLFLTALSGIDERVAGLNAGGDDYLAKPFALSELLARVQALGRRSRTTVTTVLRIADLEIDLIAHKVFRGGCAIDLQPREFQLLEYLMRYSDQVVTRAMLLENVWGLHFDPRTNVVETHISRLRAKLSRGDKPDLIQTVRGNGYRLRALA